MLPRQSYRKVSLPLPWGKAGLPLAEACGEPHARARRTCWSYASSTGTQQGPLEDCCSFRGSPHAGDHEIPWVQKRNLPGGRRLSSPWRCSCRAERAALAAWHVMRHRGECACGGRAHGLVPSLGNHLLALDEGNRHPMCAVSQESLLAFCPALMLMALHILWPRWCTSPLAQEAGGSTGLSVALPPSIRATPVGTDTATHRPGFTGLQEPNKAGTEALDKQYQQMHCQKWIKALKVGVKSPSLPAPRSLS